MLLASPQLFSSHLSSSHLCNLQLWFLAGWSYIMICNHERVLATISKSKTFASCKKLTKSSKYCSCHDKYLRNHPCTLAHACQCLNNNVQRVLHIGPRMILASGAWRLSRKASFLRLPRKKTHGSKSEESKTNHRLSANLRNSNVHGHLTHQHKQKLGTTT